MKSQLEFHYQIRCGELKDMSFEYLVDPQTSCIAEMQYRSDRFCRLIRDYSLRE